MEIKPFEPGTLLLIAALNPAVIVLAFLMGRSANQWQKLIVAAFASSLAGFILYWLAAEVGLVSVHALGGEAALLLMQMLFGLGWALLGYALRPSR
jgi:membrane protein YqaA with SNARE-associated domain